MAAERMLGYRAYQVLAFVRATIDELGHAPSYIDIQNELGFFSRSDVRKVVVRLEKRGYLYRAGQGRVRRIRLDSAHHSHDTRPLNEAGGCGNAGPCIPPGPQSVSIIVKQALPDGAVRKRPVRQP